MNQKRILYCAAALAWLCVFVTLDEPRCGETPEPIKSAETGAARVLVAYYSPGPLDPGVSKGELDSAQRLGERVARLAKKLKTSGTSKPTGAD